VILYQLAVGAGVPPIDANAPLARERPHPRRGVEQGARAAHPLERLRDAALRGSEFRLSGIQIRPAGRI
jgi:hypothetical protein